MTSKTRPYAWLALLTWFSGTLVLSLTYEMSDGTLFDNHVGAFAWLGLFFNAILVSACIIGRRKSKGHAGSK